MATLHSRHRSHRSHTNPPSNCSSTWHGPSRSATFHGDKDDVPWNHMAHTYTWVVENDYITMNKSNRKTEQWILQQQMFLAAEVADPRPAGRGPKTQRKAWDELVYSYEIEAEQWMRQEEEARRRAAERERKARIVDEEMRRIETRMRMKREEERRKMAEERQRIQEEAKERGQRNRAKAEKAVVEAWRGYEERWGTLLSLSEPLKFSSIPWPVVSRPGKAADITPQAVVSFLFSQVPSEKQTRKERVRSAQLRWHPDRFQRVLVRVSDADKAEVQEGVGIVARCLNNIKI